MPGPLKDRGIVPLFNPRPVGGPTARSAHPDPLLLDVPTSPGGAMARQDGIAEGYLDHLDTKAGYEPPAENLQAKRDALLARRPVPREEQLRRRDEMAAHRSTSQGRLQALDAQIARLQAERAQLAEESAKRPSTDLSMGKPGDEPLSTRVQRVLTGLGKK